MNRRTFLVAAALSTSAARVMAEHGWETYDQSRPLYLEGPVTTIIWADPHPHLELVQRPVPGLPAEISEQNIPRQREKVDVATLLSKAVVATRSGEVWRVELPTLARLSAWKMPRPKIEQVLGVIGFPGPALAGTPTVRAEFLFIEGRAFPMRSDPA